MYGQVVTLPQSSCVPAITISILNITGLRSTCGQLPLSHSRLHVYSATANGSPFGTATKEYRRRSRAMRLPMCPRAIRQISTDAAVFSRCTSCPITSFHLFHARVNERLSIPRSNWRILSMPQSRANSSMRSRSSSSRCHTIYDFH